MNASMNSVQEPICAYCNQAITTETVIALSKLWHSEHFKCKHCGDQIKTSNYYEHDGWPLCEKDYNALFLYICDQCRLPINESYVNALGKKWHKEHFFCDECKKSLLGSNFMEREGKPYCPYDYQKLFAIKCFGCTQPILDYSIISLGKNWHQDCFKCKICKESNPWTIKDNKPICYQCTRNKNVDK